VLYFLKKWQLDLRYSQLTIFLSARETSRTLNSSVEICYLLAYNEYYTLNNASLDIGHSLYSFTFINRDWWCFFLNQVQKIFINLFKVPLKYTQFCNEAIWIYIGSITLWHMYSLLKAYINLTIIIYFGRPTALQ